MDIITAFLKEYEQAFSAPDTDAMARAFAPHFMLSSPATVSCIANDHRFRAVLMQAASFYRSIGMRSARIHSSTEIPADDLHTMVQAEWGLFREERERISPVRCHVPDSYFRKQHRDCLYQREKRGGAVTGTGIYPRGE